MNRIVLLLHTTIALLGYGLMYSSGAVLEWNPTGEPQVAGYKAYIGMQSQNYIRVLDVQLETMVTLTGLDPGTTYYLAATAYDTNGLESDFSREILYTPPVDGDTSIALPFAFQKTADGTILQIIGNPGQRCWVVASSDLRTWQQIRTFTFSDQNVVEIADPTSVSAPMRFYRVIASRQ